MQESYISLDPERADSMSAQQRARLWNQRVQEACGGEAGNFLATQMGLTFMVGSYTMMRHRGFRLTPISAPKLAGLGGVLAAGALGYTFGSSIASVSMGSPAQYNYLMRNRGAILNGSASFDEQKAQ